MLLYLRTLYKNIRKYSSGRRETDMPSKPVLSDTDKENIRKRLKELCEECWITQGYKKTSIKSLCEKAGISVGTFYTLYPTKEDLFFETIETIQRRLEEKIFAINRDRRTKDGFAESMKELFKEYDSKPFLYNVNTPDFQSFITKLPEETIKKVKFDSFDFFRQAVRAASLELKMEESKAYGILSALLSTINAKETLSVTCDYFAVFEFMVDSLVADIFK
jgi:AcrR family transcriptional regulator